MVLLDRFFGRGARRPVKPDPDPEPADAEHAVLVHFTHASPDLSDLFDLEEQLEELLADSDVGELDGNEVATDGGGSTSFLYGRNADALFAAVRPTLEASALMRGARATLRYGPPADGVREIEVARVLTRRCSRQAAGAGPAKTVRCRLALSATQHR